MSLPTRDVLVKIVIFTSDTKMLLLLVTFFVAVSSLLHWASSGKASAAEVWLGRGVHREPGGTYPGTLQV